MPKVFYAQRLPQETIGHIKTMAALWNVSESGAIEKAFKALIEPMDRVVIEAARPGKQPLRKPGGKIL